jgi:hypothetical protein
VDESYTEQWIDEKVATFRSLSRHITKMCKDKKVILMIDEVDNASDNRVFVKFLNMLREKYIARRNNKDYTFHSVILAGVYDIKNIKLKMITEGSYTPTETESKVYNSPWNIAADYEVDMSFNTGEIATMLSEYEADHNTGMNVFEISAEIYGYTSGYPFLVSRICKYIDESLNKNWTSSGIRDSVKMILEKKSTLFDDLFKNLENNKSLYELIYDVLIIGTKRAFNIDNPMIDLGYMYGIINKENQNVCVSNKIFEIRICDYLISKDEETKDRKFADVGLQDLVRDGKFNMELCLRKFAEHYEEIFNNSNIEFIEKHGRLLFLSYLKPLINGEGFYHIESQLTDYRRMDIVVDYGREQFIIEMKIWRGEQKEKEAYEQLCGYLNAKHVDTGYLLIFDFREEENKGRKAEWVETNGRKIFEVIV